MTKGVLFFGILCFAVSKVAFSFPLSSNDKDENAYLYKNFKRNNQSSAQYKTETLFDLYFNEHYTLYYNLDSCFVNDIVSGKTIYTDDDFSYPYKDYDSYHIFNSYKKSNIKFLCSDGEYLWQPEYDEYRIKLQEAMLRNTYDFNEVHISIDESSIPPGVHLIDKYRYFTRLNGRHGLNDNNTCTLIAIQMLSSFFDTFYDDRFVPEKWDYISAEGVSNVSSWMNWQYSPGSGKESGYVDNRMRDYLLDYTINNVEPNIEEEGMTFSGQKSVLQYYLNQRGVTYTLSYCECNLHDYFTQYNKTKIKGAIDNNLPIIVNGAGHSTVAFGYDDDYVYVNNGWGWCSKVPWCVYTDLLLGEFQSSIYLIPSHYHSHTNNYFSSLTNHFYCSCGEVIYSDLINLSNLSLPSEPSSQSNSLTYNVNDYTMSISYSNAYKDENNYIIINSDGHITANVDSPFRGVSFVGGAESIFGFQHLNYTVDFLNVSGDLIYSYDLKMYTSICSSLNTLVSQNSNNGIRYIRIRVKKDPHVYTSGKIVIKKIVFSMC